MRTRTLLFLLCSVLGLSNCSSYQKDYKAALQRNGIEEDFTRFSFEHCHGYGCRLKTPISLTPQQWKNITLPFSSPKTALKERQAIANSIGNFEKTVGEIAGTKVDIHGTFKKLGDFQLDCTDESINTSIYLSLLEQEELLRHHIVLAPTTRIPLVHSGYWPHKTALIQDKNTEEVYAVDSWFHDNGAPAEIVLLEQWKDGWKPQDKQ